MEGAGEEERQKPWKNRSTEKVVALSSASLFSARKREVVIQGRAGGIEHPTWRRTQGAVSSNAGRTIETVGAFQIYSSKTKITRARPP